MAKGEPSRSELEQILDKGYGQFVVPVGLVAAHVAFLWQGYEQIVVNGGAGASAASSTLSTPIGNVLGYIAMVSLLHATRKTRASRPTELKGAMFVYNVYETLLSLVMFVVLLATTLVAGLHPMTLAVDWSSKSKLLAWGLWVNYQSKFVEYFDTLFMLLRNTEGSIKQVTGLHVWHHAVMGPIMWLIVTKAPGGSSYFGPMINSFIHTVMYGYYTATTLGISVPWKKYLTQMQMIQFVAILFHSLFHLYANISAGVAANPGSHPGQVAWWMGSEVYWPTTLGYVEFFLMLNMLWMFADFYRQAYLAQKAKKAAAAGSGKPSASSVTASSTSAASSSASSSRVQPGTLASAVPAHISEDPIPGSAEPTPTNVSSAAKRRVVRKDA